VRFDVKQLALTAVALIFTASAVSAQAPVAKVGIINIQGAIFSTKDGDRARTALRAKFEGRAKDLETRNGEVQKKKETLNKGANTMSAEARQKLTAEIEDMQKKLQWDSEDLNSEMEQENGKYVNEIGQRIVQVIDEYAKAQGLTLVLDISGQQNPVLWAATGIDISMPIIEAYDKKFGNSPAPSTAAPGASPAKPAAPGAAPAAAPKKPAGAK